MPVFGLSLRSAPCGASAFFWRRGDSHGTRTQVHPPAPPCPAIVIKSHQLAGPAPARGNASRVAPQRGPQGRPMRQPLPTPATFHRRNTRERLAKTSIPKPYTAVPTVFPLFAGQSKNLPKKRGVFCCGPGGSLRLLACPRGDPQARTTAQLLFYGPQPPEPCTSRREPGWPPTARLATYIKEAKTGRLGVPLGLPNAAPFLLSNLKLSPTISLVRLHPGRGLDAMIL